MKKLIFIMIGILLISLASASYWVTDPSNCPTEYQSQTCTGSDVVCGYSGGLTFCYDPLSIGAPGTSTTSVTDQDSGVFNGGYILDCYAYTSPEPFCEPAVCDRNSACYSTQKRVTTCNANLFGTYSCGACRSGFHDCDGDSGVCEIQDGATCATNAVYDGCDGASGNCRCISTASNCDGTGDTCECLAGASCSVGSLSGTVTLNSVSGDYCSGSSCNCVVDKSYYETGTFIEYLVNAADGAMLWFKNYGSGWLINATNVADETWGVNNDSCMVLKDGTEVCDSGDIGGGGSSYNATYDAKADYEFGSNNFSGSGNFTTTGFICDSNGCIGSGGSQWPLSSDGWIFNDSGDLNWNVTKGNENYYNKTSNLNASGFNVTADYFIGDGSLLTNVIATDTLWNLTSGVVWSERTLFVGADPKDYSIVSGYHHAAGSGMIFEGEENSADIVLRNANASSDAADNLGNLAWYTKNATGDVYNFMASINGYYLNGTRNSEYGALNFNVAVDGTSRRILSLTDLEYFQDKYAGLDGTTLAFGEKGRDVYLIADNENLGSSANHMWIFSAEAGEPASGAGLNGGDLFIVSGDGSDAVTGDGGDAGSVYIYPGKGGTANGGSNGEYGDLILGYNRSDVLGKIGIGSAVSDFNVTIGGDVNISNTLYTDSANNRVGIGVASPIVDFQVYRNGSNNVLGLMQNDLGFLEFGMGGGSSILAWDDDSQLIMGTINDSGSLSTDILFDNNEIATNYALRMIGNGITQVDNVTFGLSNDAYIKWLAAGTLEVDANLNLTTGNDVCIDGGNCLSTISGSSSSYNATYDAKADYQFTDNNFNGTGNFVTTGEINATKFNSDNSFMTNSYEEYIQMPSDTTSAGYFFRDPNENNLALFGAINVSGSYIPGIIVNYAPTGFGGFIGYNETSSKQWWALDNNGLTLGGDTGAFYSARQGDSLRIFEDDSGNTAFKIDATDDYKMTIGNSGHDQEVDVYGNMSFKDNDYLCFGNDGCSDSYIYFNGSNLIWKVN